MLNNKTTIGWQEWAELPELNIPAVKVKVDSGARTSSLHAENIERFIKGGKEYVRFDVHPVQNNKKIEINCEAPVVDWRHVTSSSGEKEHRPVILTDITLGKKTWAIELNLTKRDYMGYRMLLGRIAMEGHIVIDPEKKCLRGKMTHKQVRAKYNNN